MTSDSDPILTPSAFLAYRRANGQLPDFPAPRTVIFAPQKSLAEYVLRKYSVKQIKGFLGEFYLLKRTNGQVALSTNFGIGSPVIGGLTDEFAALGVKQFVLIGMAGGLQPELTTGSLVISTSAIRGEGVSGHYLPPNRTVDSSPELVQGINQILASRGEVLSPPLGGVLSPPLGGVLSPLLDGVLSPQLGEVLSPPLGGWTPPLQGATWTTDAPFRELRKDVLEHQRQGVLAVDMEAAAMLAVAKANQCEAIALFSIADLLSGGQWRMANDLRPAQKGLSVLFDTVMEYLLG